MRGRKARKSCRAGLKCDALKELVTVLPRDRFIFSGFRQLGEESGLKIIYRFEERCAA